MTTPELPSNMPPPLPGRPQPVQPNVLPSRGFRLSPEMYGRLNFSLLLGGLNAWGSSFFDVDEGLEVFFFVTLLITSTLCMCLLLYRFWKAIDDGDARTTPAKAAWLNLVPVFNLYWQFVCFVGLSREINKAAERSGRTDLQVSVGLAFARCAFGVIGVVGALCIAGDVSPLLLIASFSLLSAATVIIDFFLFRGYIKALREMGRI